VAAAAAAPSAQTDTQLRHYDRHCHWQLPNRKKLLHQIPVRGNQIL